MNIKLLVVLIIIIVVLILIFYLSFLDNTKNISDNINTKNINNYIKKESTILKLSNFNNLLSDESINNCNYLNDELFI